MEINVKQKAFSLLEVLLGLALSLIVIAGVAALFSGINSGVRNSARSSDLTNNVRGVFQILQHDVYMASRGIGDLNLYQFHFNNPNVSNENLFYGLANLHDDDGDSELEVQYFDYDFSSGAGNPTFAVDWPGSTGGELWPSDIPEVNLMSTIDGDPAIGSIAVGDVFVFYRSNALFELGIEQLVENLQAGPYFDERTPEDGGLGNGGFIVQVSSVEATAPESPYNCDGAPGGYLSAARVQFGGPSFSSDLSANPVLTNYTEPINDQKCPVSFFRDDLAASGWVRPASGLWLARKVGSGANYHRITYSVQNETLIRTENGQPVILASNVKEFIIEAGMDIRPLQGDDWDGAVSVLEPDFWITNMDTLAGDREQSRAYLGRHALAVRTSITFESLFDDLTDSAAGGTGRTKTRTLSNQFRIKNQHLPLRNR